ncbi:hypothetical protein ACFX15_045424 [Malus domestica]
MVRTPGASWAALSASTPSTTAPGLPRARRYDHHDSKELQTTAVKRLAGREARSTIFSVRLRPSLQIPHPSSEFIQKKI